MEGLSIHFPHEQYARYTSPDATSAYHNPYGYLSPPYSTPQQLTSEHASTWPTNGLGISQCQTSQSCQDQQNFYATSSGQFHFSVRSQRDSPVTNHSLYSSINAYPIYATVNRNLSYHVFSGYNHAPIHHSPSISIQAAPHVDHKDLNHDFYSYAPPPEGTQVESSQFRYRPDPMQEGKFIVAAPDVVFTVSEQAANVASWESADGQQYHDQHRVSEAISLQKKMITDQDRFILESQNASVHKNHKLCLCQHRQYRTRIRPLKTRIGVRKICCIVLRVLLKAMLHTVVQQPTRYQKKCKSFNLHPS